MEINGTLRLLGIKPTKNVETPTSSSLFLFGSSSKQCMYYCCWSVWSYILIITLSWHLQDCYQDLDKIEPRLIHVSCTKKHARYLHGLVKIFLRTKKQWKNYVCKKLAWFISLSCKNLLESSWIMNTPCMILVSFLCKNPTSFMTRILQTSCKDSCQDLGKDLY